MAKVVQGVAKDDVRRSLHWVFKIGSLGRAIRFYNDVFHMRVLRSEEFAEGCAATCNGPYGGRWSKTMVGYGPEKDNFALELTYNYGVDHYEKADDFRFVAIRSDETEEEFAPFRREYQIRKAKELGYNVVENEEGTFIEGPDQYCYKLINTAEKQSGDEYPKSTRAHEPFLFVSIYVSDLEKSVKFWRDHLGLQQFDEVAGRTPATKKHGKGVMLGYDRSQTLLELVPLYNDSGNSVSKIEHGTAYGRIAFATRGGPQAIYDELKKVEFAGGNVLNDPITLQTPGKADVVVTILQDPDGYEICYVNEDGFYDLSATKPGDDFVDWDSRAYYGADGNLPPSERRKKEIRERKAQEAAAKAAKEGQ